MPHLCKKMHHPGVTKKKTINPDQEPNFYEISKLFPAPEEASGDSDIGLESTMRYGPIAQVTAIAMAKIKISCKSFNL